MNDLDPLLREAMSRVRGPLNARPSLTDVRRRARRHSRRRMTATVGAVACTGVAAAALIIRRDSGGSSSLASASVDSSANLISQPSYSPTTINASGAMTVDAALVWNALISASNDPRGVAFVTAPTDEVSAQTMPTADQFGCTSDECRGMFTYVVWHEIARLLGFGEVESLQASNPNIDFSLPPREGDLLQTTYLGVVGPPTNVDSETTTTLSFFDGVTLIDGGAPVGAMEDAYQRLPGFNRVIVPTSGRTVEQTIVMPIGDNTALAAAVGEVFGIDGFDTWDPSFISSPIEGMVAVVIGPDYWDLVGDAPCSRCIAAPTTTTIVG